MAWATFCWLKSAVRLRDGGVAKRILPCNSRRRLVASVASISILAVSIAVGQAMAGGRITVRAQVLSAGPLNAATEQLGVQDGSLQGTPEALPRLRANGTSSRQFVRNGVWMRVSEGPAAGSGVEWRISLEYLGN